jgi:hypothetical protein
MPNSDYITRYTLDKLDNYEYTGKCEINGIIFKFS